MFQVKLIEGTAVKSYKTQLPVLFLAVLYQFLQQPSFFWLFTISFSVYLKKDFHHKFSFFNGFTKTPHPLNAEQLKSEKCGKEGKTGWPVVIEFLEFLELFLNCKWFLKNPWNNEFLRICSWNVLEFYFSGFIKNSTNLFHGSSFWNRCLYRVSRYYFMMLRLS